MNAILSSMRLKVIYKATRKLHLEPKWFYSHFWNMPPNYFCRRTILKEIRQITILYSSCAWRNIVLSCLKDHVPVRMYQFTENRFNNNCEDSKNCKTGITRSSINISDIKGCSLLKKKINRKSIKTNIFKRKNLLDE